MRLAKCAQVFRITRRWIVENITTARQATITEIYEEKKKRKKKQFIRNQTLFCQLKLDSVLF